MSTTHGERTLWQAYVAHFTPGETQAQVAARAGVDQTTAGRWQRGDKVPTSPAVVAKFCQSADRNPVEGFVAAGMLTLEEAGRALEPAEVQLLKSIAVVDVIVEEAAPLRRTRKSNIDR